MYVFIIVSSTGTQKDGASVAPGKRFTYHWRVIEGPSADDPPCLSYLYYSAVDPVRDSNSGLFGPIQVCNKGVLDGSGHQVTNSHTVGQYRQYGTFHKYGTRRKKT